MARQFIVLGACFVLYIVGKIIYRLYFSSLAKIPGPKIAAITSLYGFYHDALRGGQYHWVIERMHKKYGPIVRIRPNAIHMNDPEFIEPIFGTTGKRREKSPLMANGFAADKAAIGTVPHELHRSRRSALNGFFSKQAVRRLEPILHEVLDKVLRNLSDCAKSGDVLNLHTLYCAMTADIIHEYCFGANLNYLDEPDLNEQVFSAFHEAGRGVHFACYNPWVNVMLFHLPPKVVPLLIPNVQVFLDLFEILRRKIEEVRESQKSNTEMAPSIFQGLLSNPNLSEEERATDRVLDEARILIGAGTDTTAFTLACLSFHVLSNPSIMKRLKTELAEAVPDPKTMPPMAQLESLPYLTAVIQETIRLHPAASTRQERSAPDEDIFYEDPESGRKYVIPKGTIIGMSAHMLTRREDIYPSWSSFNPDRWLENPRLDRYQLAFSRGSRRCLGMNLAYSELYLMAAGIFRNYDLYDGTGKQDYPTLELFETDREDVDMVADIVVAYVKEGSKGIRVRVRSGQE